MAISAVTIHVNSGAAATSFTSASFTPTANAIHIAFMNARTGAAAIPTITDSAGNTWTLVSGTNLSVGAGNLKCSMYYWVAGASPAAMTATVTSSGAIACSLMLVAYTGAATDTANINVNQNTAGDPAPTNAAMAATSTGLAFNSQNAGAAPTATPLAQGYSSIINSAPATNLRHTLFTDSASPANSVSWTSTGTDSVGILWELKEASTGFTGTAAQTLIPVAQAASGTVTDSFTGTIAQAATRTAQAASGSFMGRGAFEANAFEVAAFQVTEPISAFQSGAFQIHPAFQTAPAAPGAITGTIVQTLVRTAQAASGTVTAAPAITGTAAQTLSPAQQSATGAVAPAITGTIVQTLAPVLQAASGSVATAGAIVGQIAQTLTRTAQAASGTVTAAPAITGTIAQTLQRAQQDATGLVAAAGTFVGTIAQTAPSATQAASGTVAAAGDIVGTIAQTAPSARQAASGTVSGGIQPPDTRPIGGFAGWSEEAEKARKKYQRLKRKAEVELREMLEAQMRGEEWPPAPVEQVLAALAEAAVAPDLPFMPDLAGLRSQLALLEDALRQGLAEHELRQRIAAQRLIEEMAIVSLLA